MNQTLRGQISPASLGVCDSKVVAGDRVELHLSHGEEHRQWDEDGNGQGSDGSMDEVRHSPAVCRLE